LNAQEIISSGILELYCTGLTSAAETAEVQQWAKQYPEVAAEIEAIQRGLEGYAQSHAITPATSVKEKIFAEISKSTATPVVNIPSAGNGTTSKIRSISSAWKYAAAASIILLLGSLIFNYSYYNKYKDASSQLASTQTELEQQRILAESGRKKMEVMSDMNARPVSLESMDSVKDNSARIYWMKNTGDVYIDPSRLPELSSDKQYQFWAIIDGKPVNGGIITREVNGKIIQFQQMKAFGNAQAFAISVEDAGPEKPVPTEVKAMGKISTSL
jgi:anti-sigma-K factor RskA